MRALGSGTERSFTHYQYDADLRIRIRTTDSWGRFFHEFRAKGNEIGALPNETFCLNIFSVVVGRYRAKYKHDENNRFPWRKPHETNYDPTNRRIKNEEPSFQVVHLMACGPHAPLISGFPGFVFHLQKFSAAR